MFNKVKNIVIMFPFIICILLIYFLFKHEDIIFTTNEIIAEDADRIKELGIIDSYGIPVKIIIEEVSINLEVKEGSYDYESKAWTLTKGFAFWANLSETISSSNTSTTIYAHNQKGEFYNLKYLGVGDKIKIVTDMGHELMFTYQYDEIVSPEDSSVIFNREETSKLVLITCNGISSKNRRILYATLD